MPWSKDILRSGMAVFVAAFAGFVSADPPTTATNSIGLGDGYGYVGFELETPYAPGPNDGHYRVSGTNCNFNVETLAVCHDGALMWVAESSLTIGGETVTLPSGFDGGSVRFASTHFADSNDDLVVVWKAKFAYEDPVHNFSGTSDWVTVEFHLNPYNRGIAFGTRMLDDSTDSELVRAFSTACVAEAKTPVVGLGHTIVPSDPWMYESDIQEELETSTFAFATTHGATTHFSDSYNVAQTSIDDGYVGFGEVNSATSGRTGNNVPTFNYVLFYSCETLITPTPPNTSPADYFHFGGSDTCYLGFEKKVGPGVALGNTDEYVTIIDGTLADHIESFMDRWAGDYGAGQALFMANTDAMPRGAPVPGPTGLRYPAVEMKLVGDDFATIKWAYLSEEEQAEFNEDVPMNWYVVWPN